MNWMREFFLQLLGGFRVFEAAVLTGSAPNMSSIVAAAFSWPDKWQLSLRCRLTMDCWRPKRELHEWALWRAALLLDTSPPTGASISWRSFWSLCFSIWSPVFFSTLLICRWDIFRVKRGFTKDRLTRLFFWPPKKKPQGKKTQASKKNQANFPKNSRNFPKTLKSANSLLT